MELRAVSSCSPWAGELIQSYVHWRDVPYEKWCPSLWACPKVPWSPMPCPFVLGHSCSQLGDLTDVPACEVPRERRQSVVPPDGLTTTKHRKALQRAKLQLPQKCKSISSRPRLLCTSCTGAASTRSATFIPYAQNDEAFQASRIYLVHGRDRTKSIHFLPYWV